MQDTLKVCMALDYLTGMIAAGIFHKSKKSAEGGLESRSGWKGLCRKGISLL
ncbi:MAG: phage holin family protein, partial [Clostridiales bacterium]|nr:phage holin family protein [Clostridiales bacterium]